MRGDSALRQSLDIRAFDIGLEELLSALLLSFFAVQGAVPFIAPNQALETTGQAASGLMFWGGILSQSFVYGSIAALLLADLPEVLRKLGAMRWVLALALWALVSSVWSQFPDYTLRRSVPFAMAALFGLWLAIRYPVDRQLRILRISMICLALATMAMVLLFPEQALDRSTGHASDWQGVFTSKNACGRIMVLATAVVLAEGRGWLRSLAPMALFVFVMVMSGSRGAWVIEGCILLMYTGLRLDHIISRRTRLVLGSLCVTGAAVAGLWLATHLRQAMPALGRDATLSGRTFIWKQVWPFVLERPFLGWGYAGFWRGLQGESFRVVAATRFIIYHAHNGFLELWLELGAAGLLLFFCGYLRAWRLLLPRLRDSRMRWCLFFLTLITLYDLDENSLLIYNGLFWVLYATVLCNLELLSGHRYNWHRCAHSANDLTHLNQRHARSLANGSCNETGSHLPRGAVAALGDLHP